MDVGQLARESRIGAALHHLSRMIRTAWLNSGARQILSDVLARLVPIRIRGFVMVVTGATALALEALKPTPVGPLGSLVPSLVIVAGVLVMLMAGPLSRAILHRTS